MIEATLRYPRTLLQQTRAELHSARQRLDRQRSRVRRVDPSAVGLAFESMTLRTDDGLRLAAWYLPGRDGPSGPLVIVHHHFGGQRATTLPWLAILADLGLAALVFDGRGHGASDVPTRDQEHFVARVCDVDAAMAYGRRRGHRRFIGLGQSQGGAVIAMALARADGVEALVLDAGPSPDMGAASLGLAGHLLGAAEDDSASRRLARLALAFELWRQSAPLSYTRRLWASLARWRGRPLLWIHGDSDTIIPRAHARLWYRALSPRSGGWRALEIEGASHCASASTEPARVREALRQLLRGRDDAQATV